MKPNQAPRAVITTDVDRHPAVKAWLAATRSGRVPPSVVVMRERPAHHQGIYRLPDVGTDGRTVYAKWGMTPAILREQLIQELVLPHLPVTTPRYYGTCVDGSDAWLFVEDVGEVRFSRTDAEHRRVAGRWFGTLHAGATSLGPPDGVSEAGPARYLGHLRAGRATIETSLGRWAFPPDDTEVLIALLRLCEVIEARWMQVEAGCDGAPATLVHGDFQPKNAFMRSLGNGLELCAIDWEMAGWGPPAIDLTRIDLSAYWGVVRDAWRVDLETVERLSRFGRVLELSAALDWKCASLLLERPEYRREAVSDLALILSRSIDAARAAHIVA
jgi:hypothetical protein